MSEIRSPEPLTGWERNILLLLLQQTLRQAGGTPEGVTDGLEQVDHQDLVRMYARHTRPLTPAVYPLRNPALDRALGGGLLVGESYALWGPYAAHAAEAVVAQHPLTCVLRSVNPGAPLTVGSLDTIKAKSIVLIRPEFSQPTRCAEAMLTWRDACARHDFVPVLVLDTVPARVVRTAQRLVRTMLYCDVAESTGRFVRITKSPHGAVCHGVTGWPGSVGHGPRKREVEVQH